MDNHPPGSTSTEETASLAVILALVGTATLVAIGSLWPQSRLWGGGWYQFFPWYVGVAVLIAAIGLALTCWCRGTTASPTRSQKGTSLAAAITLSLVLLLLFVLLRTRTHFLGDGYILLGRLESGAYRFQPWEFGPFTLEKWVFALLGGSGTAEPLAAFRLISWFSGALFMAGVSVASWRLFDTPARRLTFALGLLTGGYMLLYFGYVEHYPLFVATVALFTLTGLLVAQGSCHRLWLLPWLALGLVLHPFGVVLILPAAYLILRDTPLHHVYAKSPCAVRISLPTVAVVAGLALFVYYYQTHLFFRLAFVPLVADRFTVEGYTLFSSHHLMDMLSLVLQLTPGLIVFVAVCFFMPVRRMLKQPVYRVLVLLSLLSLGVAFVFDPKIGLPRDWDLFAFAGVPLTVLMFYALLDRASPPKVQSLAPVAMIIAAVLVLAPRVATQVSEDRSIMVFEYLAGLDPIRNKDGRARLVQYYRQEGRDDLADALTMRIRSTQLELGLHEQGMALTRAGRFDDAIATYQRVLAVDPSMATTWANIGLCYLFENRFDSARVYLEVANGVQPYNAITVHLLGKACLGEGRPADAERYWLEALRLNPDNIETYQLLMSLYREQQRGDDYREILIKASALKDAPDDLIREANDSTSAVQ